MSAGVLGGVGIALGLIWLIRSSKPALVPIGQINEWGRTDPGSSPSAPSGPRAIRRLRISLARRVEPCLRGSFFDTPQFRADLAISGSSVAQLAGEIAMSGMGAGGVTLVAAFVAIAGGAHPAIVSVAIALLITTIVGSAIPLVALRRSGDALRRKFRRGLGTFLELVALAMAGAMGVEGALDAVSSLSDDPVFRTMGARLASARVSGETLWQALSTLGEEIGLPELSEVATNLALAGSEGARIRDTLSAKASSIRRREMTQAEAEANATTEKMFVPGVVLLAGFMVFVGYPAISHVFHVL